ncbi:hypothetical protein UFOVP579_44 [uncultured Caudovirales phage]|uniref:Uncharacterized protein n=1 Tax=uncultured Caudovirales phage TaxID=2100421 RepID=A0A6J5PGU4_9CAUD|nr:hypothetical protein UFOVP302_44 [uncultured Caudovirales phage]CAB4168741.1 hypothetical protein UFOVP579_44 [uncultured Caudovirales phage]
MLKKIYRYVRRLIFIPFFKAKKTHEQRLMEYYSGKHKKQPYIEDNNTTYPN